VSYQAGILNDSGFFSPKKWLLDINSEKPYRSLSYGAFWNYERENRLYKEILPQLSMRTPLCFYSNFDRGKGEKLNPEPRRGGSY
jgi:hypothetical protein